MRIRAEVHVESEPYADMLPPLDLGQAVPGAGDEVVIADVPYACTRRRFVYDEKGRLLAIALVVRAV